MKIEHDFNDGFKIVVEGKEQYVLNALRILRDAYFSGRFNDNYFTKLREGNTLRRVEEQKEDVGFEVE